MGRLKRRLRKAQNGEVGLGFIRDQKIKMGMEFIELESDPKRKCDAMKTNLSKDTNMGKKQRLD